MQDDRSLRAQLARHLALFGNSANHPMASTRAFFARKALREAAATWYVDAEGFPSMLGARVKPLAHQIYAVLRVLRDRAQRFILADEVGLGKTIEAGLILQALWHDQPAMRVLVIVPGSMVQQWFRELYLRFGARDFRFVDSRRENSHDRLRKLASPWLIVSTGALAGDSGLRTALEEGEWDAVVVDEAHQIDASHALYPWLSRVARKSAHLLVLSATPSSREMGGLLSLLALVAPDEFRIEDIGAFTERAAQRQEIWTSIDRIRQILDAADAEERELDASDIEIVLGEWSPGMRSDPRVGQWLATAETQSPQDALNTIRRAFAYARERWSVDHRIIRTRRRTLESISERFPVRELSAELRYDASAGELELARLLSELPEPSCPDQRAWCSLVGRVATGSARVVGSLLRRRIEALSAANLPAGGREFADAFESDPGPLEEAELIAEAPARVAQLSPTSAGLDEASWLDRAVRACEMWEREEEGISRREKVAIDWIAARSKEDPNRRFLVFSETQEVVISFASHVRAQLGLGARIFHAGRTEAQLEEAATAFTSGSDTAGSPIRVLVSDGLGGEGRNFQVAWAVVHLDVPLSPARIEQRIGRVDRLGRGSEELVRSAVVVGPTRQEETCFLVHRDAFRVFQESIGGLEFVLPALVRRLREETCQKTSASEILESISRDVSESRQTADDAFQSALDTTRADLSAAKEVADILTEHTDPRAAIQWLRALDVRVIQDGHDCSEIGLSPDFVSIAIPGVARSQNIRGTWRRSLALRDESRQFIAPGHRVLDGAYSLLDGTPLGRAGFLARGLGPTARHEIFAVCVFVDELPDVRGLPPGLLSRARAMVGRDVSSIVLRWRKHERSWRRESDGRIIAALEESHQPSDEDASDRFASLSSEIESGHADLLMRLEEYQNDRRAGVSTENSHESVSRLQTAWSTELAYFEALAEVGDAEARRRSQQEAELRLQVIERVRGLSPRLEAILFVIGK